jgi:hypothetical protein
MKKERKEWEKIKEYLIWEREKITEGFYDDIPFQKVDKRLFNILFEHAIKTSDLMIESYRG